MLKYTIPLFLALTLAFGTPVSAEEPAYSKVEKTLNTSMTILGQPIHYPNPGTAKITSVIVTLKPGEETSRHKHEVPLYAYVLEGEVTIEYEGHGTKVVKAGESLMEGFDVWHVGKNTGKGPMRILGVFLGAEGHKNTIVAQSK